MTLPDRILDLSDATWPTWLQVVVSVAVLAALVAIIAIVVRGIVWLLFGDWPRAIGTLVVVGVLVQTDMLSIDRSLSWVRREWAGDSAWLTLAAVGLIAWPVWLVARHLSVLGSPPGRRVA